MNIKSLLISSTAALSAASGAHAADAIVAAEPEPMEYVRVCDAFGKGYFYIPGTETCLKFGGYARFEVRGGEAFARRTNTGDDTYRITSRFTFRVSTATDTELGALKSYVETRWNWNTDSVPGGYQNRDQFQLIIAVLELGGLRMGLDDSAFTSFTNYAGGVINDGTFGPYSTNLIAYSYENGPLRAVFSLEQGDSSVAVTDWGIDDYVPHVVGGIGYKAGMVDLSAVAAYDTRDGVGRGGWAGKLRADVTINEAASVFAMLMYGENTSGYTTWARGAARDTVSVIGGGSLTVSDKATFNIQGQWTDGNTLSDMWEVAANVAYKPVDGLTLKPELLYRSNGVTDEVGAMLRIDRSF